jgi:hypothetical protein
MAFTTREMEALDYVSYSQVLINYIMTLFSVAQWLSEEII